MASVGRTLSVSASARVLTLPITAVATVITTYLIVENLGLESYAYIVLVGTLFQLIPFADLGMGAAVVNAVAKRLDSRELAANALATSALAFRTLTVSALVILLAAIIISSFGAWPSLLGLTPAFAPSSLWAIPVVLLPFALSIPLGIGQRILIGDGRNHIASLIGVVGPVVATAATFVLLQLGTAPLLLAIATPLGIFAVSLTCFAVALKRCRWSIADILLVRRLRRRPKLWSSAAPMMVISITVPLAMQSDRLVLSHFSTAFELSEYSIAAQMYVPCFSIISMAAVALWPIFSRSGAASKPLWIKAMASLSGGGAVLALAFVLLVDPIARLITKDKLAVGVDLAIGFGSLLIVMATHQASAVLLTSPSNLAFQAICSTIMLTLNLFLSILLSPYVGASGVVWASVIAVTIAQLVPCIIKARLFMQNDRQLVPA